MARGMEWGIQRIVYFFIFLFFVYPSSDNDTLVTNCRQLWLFTIFRFFFFFLHIAAFYLRL